MKKTPEEKEATRKEKERIAAERQAARELADVRSAFLKKSSDDEKIPEWAMVLARDPAMQKCFPNIILKAVAEYFANHPGEVVNQATYISDLDVMTKDGQTIKAIDLLTPEANDVICSVVDQFEAAQEDLKKIIKWVPEYDEQGNLLNGATGWREFDFRKVESLTRHVPREEIDSLCAFIVAEVQRGRSVAGIKILDVINDAKKSDVCLFQGFTEEENGEIKRIYTNAHNYSQGLSLFFAQRIPGSQHIIPLNPREIKVREAGGDVVMPGQFLRQG